MTNDFILYLTASDVKKLLPMFEAVALMRTAFSQLSAGKVDSPVRLNINIAREGKALFMPVYSSDISAMSVKTVSVTPSNLKNSLPLIHAMVSLFDTETGQQTALLDGEYLTALRTGAASGLATDLLARKDAKTAFIFGAGAQAETQIAALLAVRKLSHVSIFDPDFAKAEKLAQKIVTEFSVGCAAVQNLTNLAKADVICTATTASNPVFKPELISPGTHINGIGSYTPDMCEIPAATIGAAKVFVDQRAACLSEAGDIVNAIKTGFISDEEKLPEIGELIERIVPGRKSKNEITVFKSVGNAVQDLYCAQAIYAKARKRGMGLKLPRE
ncbi:MAG: ornithine cyclodeaminase [Calditrichaeota bacterium]|nr:MAG: ornithine cyclodeaminase [Calditrichota bacterium]